jgi:hypothetical protein
MLAAAIALGSTLAGCSDIYYDRRESIALSAGDAVATNIDTHMVDPWPRRSGDRNLAFNGERMQKASECYRQDRVKPLIPWSTSSQAGQQAQTTGSSSCSPTVVPTAPAAPVK